MINIYDQRDYECFWRLKVRGDPDGCGLDLSLRYSPSSELRVDLPTEELLNIKKGWLMKQGSKSDVSIANVVLLTTLANLNNFTIKIRISRNGTNIGLYSGDPRCYFTVTPLPKTKASWMAWLI